MQKIYTTEQVADILQIHPLTVLNYIRQKRLKAAKLGRIYRISESALQLFLDHEST